MRRTAAAVVLAAGLVAAGSGFLNGDAAAYAAQGWQGDLWHRPVHFLWCLLAVVVAQPAGDALPWVLDLATACAAAWMVWRSGARGAGAWVAAGSVLPWCAFGEVDLPWMAFGLGAALARTSLGSGVASACAVGLSPVALLALPWIGRQRGSWAPWIGAAAAVVALLIGSQGEWLWGHRGMIRAEWLPGRTLEAWVRSGVWVVVGAVAWWAPARARRLVWLTPLLLAPPDVPGWVLVGVVTARDVGEGAPAPRWTLAALVGALGAVGLAGRQQQVTSEHRALVEIARAHQPGQAYEGPWSWGTRLAVIATKQTDGVPFRPLRPLRSGEWPAPAAREVGLLPPGRPPPGGRDAHRVDARGVHWVRPWWSPKGR